MKKREGVEAKPKTLSSVTAICIYWLYAPNKKEKREETSDLRREVERGG